MRRGDRGNREWREERGWTSDARPSPIRPKRQQDPEEHKPKRFGRRMARALTLGLFVAGAVVVVVGDGGLRDLASRSSQLRELETELERRTAEVEALRREVHALDEGRTGIERVAREDLGMVAPNERTFLLPDG